MMQLGFALAIVIILILYYSCPKPRRPKYTGQLYYFPIATANKAAKKSIYEIEQNIRVPRDGSPAASSIMWGCQCSQPSEGSSNTLLEQQSPLRGRREEIRPEDIGEIQSARFDSIIT